MGLIRKCSMSIFYTVVRHPIFCFTLLHCASEMWCFLHREGLWQPCVELDCRHHFSSSVCSLHVCVSRFGSSHNSSRSVIIIICDGGLWPGTFGVTTIIGGHHRAHPREAVSWPHKRHVCSDNLDWAIPISIPLLRSPCSLRRNSITNRPIIKPSVSLWVFKWKSCASLTLHQARSN